jgi:simple sugar transport system ATP-binding protein
VRGETAVALKGIRKSFYGVVANDGVDFDLKWGEVHALLGENGAGKSTLCSVLAGLYRADAGEITIDGHEVDFRSPHDALEAGVGMVYQHFRLVEGFTVAENIALGRKTGEFRLSTDRIEAEVAELSERYGMYVPPDARIWQLSVGEQQRVEILKLLHRGARVLILDEPTAVLTPQEADELFATVERMSAEGKAIIFVSHKLDEVLKVSDRITVLRDGRRVGETATTEADVRSLARMMVGRELQMPVRVSRESGEPVLTVRNLTVAGDRGFNAVTKVDLEVCRGQIVGIAGVAGNGQRELAEALAGLRPIVDGEILIEGSDVTKLGPSGRIDLGLGFVPEDRLGMGLAAGLTLEENLVIKSYRKPPHAKGIFVSAASVTANAEDLISRFDIRGDRIGLPVQLLSGGNLQRAILAREISQDPKALVAASPTRGLDVAAMEAIQRLLLDQRDEGTAILLISEDLEEIQSLSDEILVMFGGEIVGRALPSDFDAEEVGLMMAGHGRNEAS